MLILCLYFFFFFAVLAMYVCTCTVLTLRIIIMKALVCRTLAIHCKKEKHQNTHIHTHKSILQQSIQNEHPSARGLKSYSVDMVSKSRCSCDRFKVQSIQRNELIDALVIRIISQSWFKAQVYSWHELYSVQLRTVTVCCARTRLRAN